MSEITQDELVNATTPEALAALMAKAGEAAAQPEGETVETTQQQADGQAGAVAAEGAAPSAKDEDIGGVATKSGKGVLPYRVLQEAREDAQHSKAAAKSLATQLAETQRALDEATAALNAQQQAAGTKASSAPDEITDEDIAAVEEDFPAMAKAMRVARAAAQAASAATAKPAATAADPQDERDDAAAAVHAAMQGNDLLIRAQQRGGAIWARAKELDGQLMGNPNFKTLDERFREVNRLLADELGVPLTSAPALETNQPEARRSAAPIEQPRINTTSDLSGGQGAGGDAFGEQVSGMAMARRFSNMDPNQIDAIIRRSA